MKTLRQLKNDYNLVEILDENFLNEVTEIPMDYDFQNFPINNDFVIKYPINFKTICYTFVQMTGKIELYTYYREDYKFEFLMELDLKEIKENAGGLKSNVNEDYLKGRFRKNDAALSGLFMVLRVLYYISIKLQERNTVYKTTKKNLFSNKTSTKSNNRRKKIEVLNKDKVVYLKMNTDLDFLKVLRNYTRKTESWNVVGHYRHLKSGKVVWVQPYRKGNKEMKTEPKKYIIK